MHATLEIPTTQVQSNSHILLMSLETIIVQLDISIEHLVGIDSLLLHPLEHAGGTKVRKQWIVNLNVATPGFV